MTEPTGFHAAEPIEAFPYAPPTDEIRKQYKEIFQLNKPIKVPLPKLIFDKLISTMSCKLKETGMHIKMNGCPKHELIWGVLSKNSIWMKFHNFS
ncbi:MAG: hypothetical protein ACOYI4_10175, partial [Christensenellales bacterium]|jgi:hypothetical protein